MFPYLVLPRMGDLMFKTLPAKRPDVSEDLTTKHKRTNITETRDHVLQQRNVKARMIYEETQGASLECICFVLTCLLCLCGPAARRVSSRMHFEPHHYSTDLGPVASCSIGAFISLGVWRMPSGHTVATQWPLSGHSVATQWPLVKQGDLV